MRASIKDVAAQANVSRGTVSHVLNGRTDARISLETQARVRQAAKDLNYTPNQMAVSLFRRRTRLIGMITTGIGNPFFTELIGASETAIAEAGYQRLIDASVPYVATARPEILSVWPVDGILMHAAVGRVSEGILGGRVAHVPVVYLDSPADAHRDTVQFDLRPGVTAAAKHLLARGHTRIGIISPYEQFDLFTKQRYQPLYAACQGLHVSFQYFKLGENSQPSAVQTGLQIAALKPSERPTALFCHDDYLAIGVYHGLRRAGLCPPEDMALVGQGGIEAGECLDRPLSTIQCPVDTLCRIAVAMLRERIERTGREGTGREGPGDAPPRHVTVPTVFVSRATT